MRTLLTPGWWGGPPLASCYMHECTRPARHAEHSTRLQGAATETTVAVHSTPSTHQQHCQQQHHHYANSSRTQFVLSHHTSHPPCAAEALQSETQLPGTFQELPEFYVEISQLLLYQARGIFGGGDESFKVRGARADGSSLDGLDACTVLPVGTCGVPGSCQAAVAAPCQRPIPSLQTGRTHSSGLRQDRAVAAAVPWRWCGNTLLRSPCRSV